MYLVLKTVSMWWIYQISFKRACTLMQKSYDSHTPGICVGVHMQNVSANVRVLQIQSFCIFSCILTLLIMLIKPLRTKTYDRCASGDCGTSGLYFSPRLNYMIGSLRMGAYIYIVFQTFLIKWDVITLSLCRRIRRQCLMCMIPCLEY